MAKNIFSLVGGATVSFWLKSIRTRVMETESIMFRNDLKRYDNFLPPLNTGNGGRG